MTTSFELPPDSLDPEVQEYLDRKFIELINSITQTYKFPIEPTMPYKPQVGDVHYFGDPATYTYDAAITDEGIWAYQSTGWQQLKGIAEAPIDGNIYGRQDAGWTSLSGGLGETNTGSNVGTDGVGVFDGKVGVDLQFRHVAPADDTILVALNNNDIDISVREDNLSIAAGQITGSIDADTLDLRDSTYFLNTDVTAQSKSGPLTLLSDSNRVNQLFFGDNNEETLLYAGGAGLDQLIVRTGNSGAYEYTRFEENGLITLVSYGTVLHTGGGQTISTTLGINGLLTYNGAPAEDMYRLYDATDEHSIITRVVDSNKIAFVPYYDPAEGVAYDYQYDKEFFYNFLNDRWEFDSLYYNGYDVLNTGDAKTVTALMTFTGGVNINTGSLNLDSNVDIDANVFLNAVGNALYIDRDASSQTSIIFRDETDTAEWYITHTATGDLNFDLVSGGGALLYDGVEIGTVDDLDKKQDQENGFVNRTDSTLSWQDSNRQLTISPVGSYDYFHNHIRYTENTVRTVNITDSEGMWYFYYNGTTLTATQTFTPEIITQYAFVAYLYWNAADNKAIFFGDERHGAEMDSRTHLYNHLTIGTRYGSGLALSYINADEDGSDDSHVTIACSDGSIWDEDINHLLVDGDPQRLINNGTPDGFFYAEIPVYYRIGTGNGVWRKKDANKYPVHYVTSGRPYYNQWTGSEWQLTEVPNNDYVVYHYFATNDIDEPLIAVMGQTYYGNIGDAHDGAENEIGNLNFGDLGTLTPEFMAIGSVIFECADVFTNTINARIVSTADGYDYIDWRTVRGFGSVLTGGNADTLNGLTAGQFLRSDIDDTALGRITFANTDDVDLDAISGAAIFGGDGSGAHMAIDANELQAKAGPTTAAQLYLNLLGGGVQLGSSASDISIPGTIITDLTLASITPQIFFVDTNQTGTADGFSWDLISDSGGANQAGSFSIRPDNGTPYALHAVMSGTTFSELRLSGGGSASAFAIDSADDITMLGNLDVAKDLTVDQHTFNSVSAADLSLNSLTTSTGLRIDNNGTIRGYLYGDSNGFGLLDDDRNWAYRVITDASHEWRINNIQEMWLNADELRPHTTNGLDLGNSSYYWNNAYITNLELASKISITASGGGARNFLHLRENTDAQDFAIHYNGTGTWEFRSEDSTAADSDRFYEFNTALHVWLISNVAELYLDANYLRPVTNEGLDLGSASFRFDNIYGSQVYEGTTRVATQTDLTDGSVSKLADQTQNASGNFHMFVNDGGGNIGMRWNSTTGSSNALVENGQAFELEIYNDVNGGDFSIKWGDTSTGTAGDPITWSTAFLIDGANGHVTIPEELYIGKNGGGDSNVHFYDDNSNTWRTFRWDDSANEFIFELNDGTSWPLYREGTWTPYLNDTTSGQTYSTQEGYYRKIGKICFFTGCIEMSSLGSLSTSGSAIIGGLPFTAMSTTDNYGNGQVQVNMEFFDNISAGTNVSGAVRQGDDYIRLWRVSELAGRNTFLLVGDISADGIMEFSGFYFTSN